MKPRKYRNTPTVVDGIRFDSKGEAKRYGELRMLEKSGEVKELKRQIKFELRVKDFLVESYFVDFTYYEKRGTSWVFVCEDFKGALTPSYIRKRKWMKGVHGINIRETGARHAS